MLLFARRALAIAIPLALAATVMGAAAPARADVVCTDDGCDGGAWQQARGVNDENSYWQMGAGHDCTNYVAWKVIGDGVQRPATGPGNAADWADHARADGYVVDRLPEVGAVAQWGAFEGGSPLEGHVAYVEAVNTDGTILVSEDAWHADGSGPLRFRVLDAASVPWFIHYSDFAGRISQVVAGPGRWAQSSTGVLAHPDRLTAVSMGARAPQVVYTEAGQLMTARPTTTGWQATPTGIASQARELSAVNMGGSSATVVSLEGDRLVISRLEREGWRRVDVGISITGQMSAVNAGGQWPTIMIAQGGDLFRLDHGPTGWAVTTTGLSALGDIAAVDVGGGLIDVYSIEGGVLMRSWSDGVWWHKDSTGIRAASVVDAVGVDGSAHVVVSDGTWLFDVYRGPEAWQWVALNVRAGTVGAALDGGGLYPVVYQVR